MDVARYLERIGFDRAPRADLRTLYALHRAHLRSVPFENLDIRRGLPIDIDPRASYAKVVERRRGGFCYELNGLFAALLDAIGFEVVRLAAQVHSAERGGYGLPFAHLALLVRCGADRYLADVGFGDSFDQPLRFGRARPQRRAGRWYTILEAPGGAAFVMARRSGDDASEPWQPQFRFDLAPHAMTAFEPMSRHQQTAPDSHFTQRTICSRAIPGGRLSLADGRLIETRAGRRVETVLEDDAAIRAVLQERFGIRG